MYEGIIQDLIDELGRLPGVGPKSAQRIAFHLLQADQMDVRRLAEVLIEVKARVKFCSICFNVSEDDQCRICRDPRRDQTVLCVVEEYKDVVAIERTREFKGRYHVLGGAISPIDGVGPDQLRIRELMVRLADGAITEVILATDPNLEGEATATYLTRMLREFGLRITRLASGLPVGGDLEYADEVTLGRALQEEDRQNEGSRVTEDELLEAVEIVETLDSTTEDFAASIADSVESFLIALRAVSREGEVASPSRCCCSKISQVLLAGRASGCAGRLRAALGIPARRRTRSPTSTTCGSVWPSCRPASTPTASSSTPTTSRSSTAACPTT